MTITALTPADPGFAAAVEGVAALFAAREAEFGVNPAIDRMTPAIDAFANAPAAFAAEGPAVVLTTYAPHLRPALAALGFAEEPIDWPAGPDGSAAFRRGGEGRLRYIEVVNEDDPKLVPAHVLTLTDAAGLAGGTICAITGDAAWLAVMAVRRGVPPGSGGRLFAALAADLARRGLTRIDLGTQTAEAFYAGAGLEVTHRLVQALRFRDGPKGPVWSDLVMMTGRL